MKFFRVLRRPVWRVLIPGVSIPAILFGIWTIWSPGLDIQDGRHDRGNNAIWLAHGWIGADSWFVRYNKTNEISRYRDSRSIHDLAAKLKAHGINTVYPHLCPVNPDGVIAETSPTHVEQFLDAMAGIQVVPWIGGPNGSAVTLSSDSWRSNFCQSAHTLLFQHPRLAGIQVNIEPLPDGDVMFLQLLDELRQALPRDKRMSVAAYPPPTRWHPYPEVHWSENYFRQVARRSDEMTVMMYDSALRVPKLYQQLMADWTIEILHWSEGRRILLGIPTYADEGVGYHDPSVENITNALSGIHRGLSRLTIPTNYLGVALYSDWETDPSEWAYFREHFLAQ